MKVTSTGRVSMDMLGPVKNCDLIVLVSCESFCSSTELIMEGSKLLPLALFSLVLAMLPFHTGNMHAWMIFFLLFS